MGKISIHKKKQKQKIATELNRFAGKSVKTKKNM